MLLIPKKLKAELDEVKREAGAKFVKDKVISIAHAYYSKFKDIKELWILFAAKRDRVTGRINVMIRAADKGRKHEIDVPIQGCQLWYTNQQTGEARPEWILPLSLPNSKDSLERVSEGNTFIKSSIENASKKIGLDLMTGKKV